MCEYCERKPAYMNGKFIYWYNETQLDDAGIVMGLDEHEQIYLSDYEYGNKWYPNFCPVCGRQLRGHRQYTTTLENALPLDKLCEWLAENAWHIDCSDCDGEHCDCPQLHDDGNSPAFWKEKLTKWIEGLK